MRSPVSGCRWASLRKGVRPVGSWYRRTSSPDCTQHDAQPRSSQYMRPCGEDQPVRGYGPWWGGYLVEHGHQPVLGRRGVEEPGRDEQAQHVTQPDPGRPRQAGRQAGQHLHHAQAVGGEWSDGEGLLLTSGRGR